MNDFELNDTFDNFTFTTADNVARYEGRVVKLHCNRESNITFDDSIFLSASKSFSGFLDSSLNLEEPHTNNSLVKPSSTSSATQNAHSKQFDQDVSSYDDLVNNFTNDSSDIPFTENLPHEHHEGKGTIRNNDLKKDTSSDSIVSYTSDKESSNELDGGVAETSSAELDLSIMHENDDVLIKFISEQSKRKDSTHYAVSNQIKSNSEQSNQKKNSSDGDVSEQSKQKDNLLHDDCLFQSNSDQSKQNDYLLDDDFSFKSDSEQLMLEDDKASIKSNLEQSKQKDGNVVSIQSNLEQSKALDEISPESDASINTINSSCEDLNLSEEISHQLNINLSSWGLPEIILQKYEDRKIKQMFAWQVDCLTRPGVLGTYKNLVYSAPTSAGKTLVAEILAIKTVLERQKKVIFILPFVSVVREKMFYFKDILGTSGVRVEGFMGSYNPPGGFRKVNVAICTIEKANSLVNRLLEEGNLGEIGAVVVDEMHLLGDSGRGYLLELLLTKLRYMSLKDEDVNIQIIGMSATLPNLSLLAGWLDAELFTTDFRPIPLHEQCIVQGEIYDNKFKLQRKLTQLPELQTDTNNVLQLCLETIESSCSVLIFCPSKNWCESLAQQISSAFFKIGSSKSDLGVKLRNQLNSELILECLEQLKRCPVGLDAVLAKTVSFGVAYHHAGLTIDERDIIEGAFKCGSVRVLIATSTLSSGVNLPARRVLIRSPMFNGKPLDTLTYRQMIGRAGRMGKDSEGESLLICQKKDHKIAKELMSANLRPIESCLEGAGKLKRAILEVITSEVASSPEEIELFTKCTLLAADPNRDTEINNPIEDSISFLIDNEFIRLQSDQSKYIATSLAKACLSSSLPPEEGLALFTELEKARQCFVLETELHLIYLVTPYSACNQMGNLDWMAYLEMWEKLPASMKRVGELVGVRVSYIISGTRGKIQSNTSKLFHKLQVHKRFYTALALQDLVNEIPLNTVANKFGCNRGMLQALQQSAATFAGMVTSFSKQLGWSSVELLVSQFQDRLQFGISRELLDLMKMPLLNGQRARILYNAGIESLIDLANTDACTLENILCKAKPFETEKEREGESAYDADKRNKLRTVWVTGKQGLTEKEAAELLIQDARVYLQLELGLKEAHWEDEQRENKRSRRRKADEDESSDENVSSEIKESNRNRRGENVKLKTRGSNRSGREGDKNEEIYMKARSETRESNSNRSGDRNKGSDVPVGSERRHSNRKTGGNKKSVLDVVSEARGTKITDGNRDDESNVTVSSEITLKIRKDNDCDGNIGAEIGRNIEVTSSDFIKNETSNNNRNVKIILKENFARGNVVTKETKVKVQNGNIKGSVHPNKIPSNLKNENEENMKAQISSRPSENQDKNPKLYKTKDNNPEKTPRVKDSNTRRSDSKNTDTECNHSNDAKQTNETLIAKDFDNRRPILEKCHPGNKHLHTTKDAKEKASAGGFENGRFTENSTKTLRNHASCVNIIKQEPKMIKKSKAKDNLVIKNCLQIKLENKSSSSDDNVLTGGKTCKPRKSRVSIVQNNLFQSKDKDILVDDSFSAGEIWDNLIPNCKLHKRKKSLDNQSNNKQLEKKQAKVMKSLKSNKLKQVEGIETIKSSNLNQVEAINMVKSSNLNRVEAIKVEKPSYSNQVEAIKVEKAGCSKSESEILKGKRNEEKMYVSDDDLYSDLELELDIKHFKDGMGENAEIDTDSEDDDPNVNMQKISPKRRKSFFLDKTCMEQLDIKLNSPKQSIKLEMRDGGEVNTQKQNIKNQSNKKGMNSLKQSTIIEVNQSDKNYLWNKLNSMKNEENQSNHTDELNSMKQSVKNDLKQFNKEIDSKLKQSIAKGPKKSSLSDINNKVISVDINDEELEISTNSSFTFNFSSEDKNSHEVSILSNYQNKRGDFSSQSLFEDSFNLDSKVMQNISDIESGEKVRIVREDDSQFLNDVNVERKSKGEISLEDFGSQFDTQFLDKICDLEKNKNVPLEVNTNGIVVENFNEGKKTTGNNVLCNDSLDFNSRILEDLSQLERLNNVDLFEANKNIQNDRLNNGDEFKENKQRIKQSTANYVSDRVFKENFYSELHIKGLNRAATKSEKESSEENVDVINTSSGSNEGILKSKKRSCSEDFSQITCSPMKKPKLAKTRTQRSASLSIDKTYIISSEKLYVSNQTSIKEEEFVDLTKFEIIDVCRDLKLFNCFKSELLELKEVAISLACERFMQVKTLIGIKKSEEKTEGFICKDVRLNGLGFCFGGNVVYHMDLNESVVLRQEKVELLKMIFEESFGVRVRAFDAKEQVRILKQCTGVEFNCSCDDPKVADWLLDPEGQEKSMRQLTVMYAPEGTKLCEMAGKSKGVGSLGLELNSTIDSRIRCSIESILTWNLMNPLKNLLSEREDNLPHTYEIETNCSVILAQIEITGFGVDMKELQNLADKINSYTNAVEAKAFELAGRRFSFIRSTDVAKVLGIYKGKKINTNKKVLHKTETPLSNLILLWRRLNSALTKMVQPLLRLVDNQRIHGKHITHSATGRISMQEPSLQNMPRDFEFEHPLRKERVVLMCRRAFCAKEKNVLVSADYCQLELRLLAHFSQDRALCGIMRTDEDVFKLIAAKWNNISKNDVTELIRGQTKQICYGIIYGMGIRTLADQLCVEEEEAMEFTETFHHKYPGIKQFINATVAQCQETGYVQTIAGRRRYLPHITDTNPALKSQAERQAVNTMIQGSAADIVKNVMTLIESKVRDKFKSSRNKPKMVLHLHDELIYEVSSKYVEVFSKLLKRCMQDTVKLSIPFPVKLKKGPNWSDMKDYSI